MKKTLLLFVLILLVGGFSLQAAVRLPKLIGDGMVLQRDAKLKLWGWADAKETVALSFNKKTYKTAANAEGYWEVSLPAQKAGGPYTMQINSITVADILVGDVWVCSGQSNMVLPVRRVLDLYADEVAAANNPQVRFFIIEPLECVFTAPAEDVSGGEWKAVTPENIQALSAAAYFFAQELYATYKIPVGLIQSAVGGSPVEAWLSEEALLAFPEHLNQAKQCAVAGYIDSVRSVEGKRGHEWQTRLNQQDKGIGEWHKNGIDLAEWKPMDLPGYWADKGLGALNGVFWFRKSIAIPAALAAQEATLRLGCIVDADSIWVNGVFVGNTTYQYPPRIYRVPAGVLKSGDNTIAIRVVSNAGRGGFVEDKPFRLIIGSETFDLAGKWRYRIGAVVPPPPHATTFHYKPEGLYNAMIAPLISYAIKGVIWYQGESNTERVKEYAALFPALIADWRSKWSNPTMPFLYVQLASFMTPDAYPQESRWADLREVQRQTLTRVPHTGMAVIIDIGEWNDIHPLNKKDVGRRLALQARRVAYGDDAKVVASGPAYESASLRGDSLVLSFSNTGSGIATAADEPLRGFAVSEDGKRFVWANARVEGSTVVVWSDAVKRPTVARYAWGNNPQGANLRSIEGLPASPFATGKIDE
ncbi:MAG: sialate O-acetylesterase [Prevotellaceae bacterium]|jgi:sialate O-acetylesterase|nr:sialate O-acetylesterase [Prevotellaceae bacterium]